MYFSYSPYNFVLGNPMIYKDPYGLAVVAIEGGYRLTGDDIDVFKENLRLLNSGQTKKSNFYEALEKGAENGRFLNNPFGRDSKKTKIVKTDGKARSEFIERKERETFMSNFRGRRERLGNAL